MRYDSSAGILICVQQLGGTARCARVRKQAVLPPQSSDGATTRKSEELGVGSQVSMRNRKKRPGERRLRGGEGKSRRSVGSSAGGKEGSGGRLFDAMLHVGLAILPPLVGGGAPLAMLQLCTVYYIGAAAVHYVLPRVVRATPALQHKTIERGQVAREAVLSLGALLVKALVFDGVERLHRAGWTKLYDGPNIAPTPSVAIQAVVVLATILALDVLHDTWFYFTHRLMHEWRWLYRRVHYLHHESKVPTPFSAYSLHVGEAAIVFFDEILVCFVFPIHTAVHRAYHLYTTLIHIGGHAQFELHPLVPSLEQILWLALGGRPHRPSAWLNTVCYHNVHHAKPRKHMSLYFTHWDTLLGTAEATYWFGGLEAVKRVQREAVQDTYAKGGRGPRMAALAYHARLLACMGGTLAAAAVAYTAAFHALKALPIDLELAPRA